MLTHTERSAHCLTATPDDTPTAGARDFGDQATRVPAAKDTADGGKVDNKALRATGKRRGKVLSTLLSTTTISSVK